MGSAVKFSLRMPSQITLLRPLIEIASDSLWSLGASVEEKQFFNFPASTNTSVVVVLTYSSLRKKPIILLIGPATRDICSNQSELLSRSGQWHVISMEFLRSFPRCNLAINLVAASGNVGSFLRLTFTYTDFNLVSVYECWSDNEK